MYDGLFFFFLCFTEEKKQICRCKWGIFDSLDVYMYDGGRIKGFFLLKEGIEYEKTWDMRQVAGNYKQEDMHKIGIKIFSNLGSSF